MAEHAQSTSTGFRGWLVAVLLAAALMLGGGGSPNPASELALQLLFAMGVLAWMWGGTGQRGAAGPDRQVWWFAGLLLAVPILQLIPLPPSLWTNLPGRTAGVEALELVGESGAWRPLSISPSRTLASILAMIPPVLMMLAAAHLRSADRRRLLIAVVAVALAAALLGLMQLLAGEGSLRIYERSHPGWITGFHANRNAAADLFLCGSLALSGWFAMRSRHQALVAGQWATFATLQGVLFFALLMTGSRAGIALSLVSLLGGFAMLRVGGLLRIRRIIVAGVLGAAALFLAVLPGRLATVSDRFASFDDPRPDLWQDTLAAISAHWPAGSGVGTFVQAFLPHERFEVLDTSMPNRAHNDYLEFLLEAGVIAPIAILLAMVILVRMTLAKWRECGRSRVETLVSLAILLVMALHSIVDYPLRNMAGACLTGLAVGLLAARRQAIRQPAGETSA